MLQLLAGTGPLGTAVFMAWWHLRSHLQRIEKTIETVMDNSHRITRLEERVAGIPRSIPMRATPITEVSR